MTERPILFSSPMVRALLDGGKTQTRRIAKMTDAAHVKEPGRHRRWHPADPNARLASPYGQPGDNLWVRETWAAPHSEDARPPRAIQVDQMRIHYAASEDRGGLLWRPSIHMPRWASRITLEITSVRIERLWDMEGQTAFESDALKEGIHAIHHGDGEYCYHMDRTDPHPSNWIDPTDAYRELWEQINGIGSWDQNPWVWVIEFKVIKP